MHAAKDILHFERSFYGLRPGLEELQEEFASALVQFGYDDAAAFAIRLAIEEAVVNGFRHGNKGDATKRVLFRSSIAKDRIDIEVFDEGTGFNPDTVPDPTQEENLEIPSGRGVMLMKAYMSEVEYLAPGNHLRMSYAKRHD
ncbi:MAG: ATP-binding protein [Phycisphaerales bacterium]|nr:ATP-binding protein [Phycisphaerales bacterium]